MKIAIESPSHFHVIGLLLAEVEGAEELAIVIANAVNCAHYWPPDGDGFEVGGRDAEDVCEPPCTPSLLSHSLRRASALVSRSKRSVNIVCVNGPTAMAGAPMTPLT